MKRYIIQRAVEAIAEESPEEAEGVAPVVTFAPAGPDSKLWEDFAVKEIRPRIQRRTIVGISTTEIPDAELPQFFRALDEESGEVVPVRVEIPPPAPAKRKVG